MSNQPRNPQDSVEILTPNRTPPRAPHPTQPLCRTDRPADLCAVHLIAVRRPTSKLFDYSNMQISAVALLLGSDRLIGKLIANISCPLRVPDVV